MSRSAKWIAVGLTVSVIVTVISTCTLRKPLRSGTDADIPARPTLFAKFKGTYRSPDGECSVYVYTGDPGALGFAWMWVYARTSRSPSEFVLVFEGEIEHGDAVDISWVNACEIQLKHLSPAVAGYATTVVDVSRSNIDHMSTGTQN